MFIELKIDGTPILKGSRTTDELLETLGRFTPAAQSRKRRSDHWSLRVMGVVVALLLGAMMALALIGG